MASSIYTQTFEAYAIGESMTAYNWTNYNHNAVSGQSYIVAAGKVGALNGGQSKVYRSYLVDGNDDTLNTFSNDSDFNYTTGDFTRSFWIKGDLSGNKVVFAKGVSAASGMYLESWLSKIYLTGCGTGWFINPTWVVTNAWHMVTIRKSGTTWYMNLDGANKETFAKGNIISTAAGLSIMSAWTGLNAPNANISEWREYNRCLTDNEVLTLYSLTNETTLGLVAYWRCVDTSGTTMTDELGTHNGVLINITPGTFFSTDSPSGSTLPGYSSYLYDEATALTRKNLVIDFDVTANSANYFGIAFRYTTSGGYLLTYDTTGASPVVLLSTFTGNDPFTNSLVSDFSAYCSALTNVTHVKIELADDRFLFYFNNSLYVDYTDTTAGRHTAGSWGLSAYGTGWSIDNITVTIDDDDPKHNHYYTRFKKSAAFIGQIETSKNIKSLITKTINLKTKMIGE